MADAQVSMTELERVQGWLASAVMLLDGCEVWAFGSLRQAVRDFLRAHEEKRKESPHPAPAFGDWVSAVNALAVWSAGPKDLDAAQRLTRSVLSSPVSQLGQAVGSELMALARVHDTIIHTALLHVQRFRDLPEDERARQATSIMSEIANTLEMREALFTRTVTMRRMEEAAG